MNTTANHNPGNNNNRVGDLVQVLYNLLNSRTLGNRSPSSPSRAQSFQRGSHNRYKIDLTIADTKSANKRYVHMLYWTLYHWYSAIKSLFIVCNCWQINAEDTHIIELLWLIQELLKWKHNTTSSYSPEGGKRNSHQQTLEVNSVPSRGHNNSHKQRNTGRTNIHLPFALYLCFLWQCLLFYHTFTCASIRNNHGNPRGDHYMSWD